MGDEFRTAEGVNALQGGTTMQKNQGGERDVQLWPRKGKQAQGRGSL